MNALELAAQGKKERRRCKYCTKEKLLKQNQELQKYIIQVGKTHPDIISKIPIKLLSTIH